MIITIEQIINKMNTLDTLEIAEWLVHDVKRVSLNYINSIYDDRLAVENKVLEVFQDTVNPLTENEINSFFELVSWKG